MSPSHIDEPAKKHKKSKGLLLEADERECDSKKPRKSKKTKADKTTASTPVDADMIESPAEPVKEKLRKKRKKSDGDDVSEAPQGVEDEPEKKKKKHRHKEEAAEQADLQTEGDSSERKKKKKKREEVVRAEDGEQAHQEEGKRGDEAVGDHGIDDPPSSSKKEKKEKKKCKQREDEGQETKRKEKSKKKRTRNSSSGFPNPGEDESLSDQARKALEYAFAQFENPDSWKFHKARQNWILRNIWSDETIPEKYMSLAMRYLQGVQGGARETLIKSCGEAVESSKPTAVNADSVEKEEPPSKYSEALDPTKKPTVRFTVDEQEGYIPSPTDHTKRQRAALILTTLTS